MGVVVRRYIDFLILLIPTPLVSVLFAAASLLFVHFFNVFRFCSSTFYEEVHTNVRFISCDGHHSAVLASCRSRSRGRALYRDASRAGRLRTGPASLEGQRSRTRRRSQCMPRRLRL